MTAVKADLERIVRREHPDPHNVLGAHPGDGGALVRAYRPNAAAVTVITDGGKA
jgi:1,4-alpha-glucan branching enzyme